MLSIRLPPLGGLSCDMMHDMAMDHIADTMMTSGRDLGKKESCLNFNPF